MATVKHPTFQDAVKDVPDASVSVWLAQGWVLVGDDRTDPAEVTILPVDPPRSTPRRYKR